MSAWPTSPRCKRRLGVTVLGWLRGKIHLAVFRCIGKTPYGLSVIPSHTVASHGMFSLQNGQERATLRSIAGSDIRARIEASTTESKCASKRHQMATMAFMRYDHARDFTRDSWTETNIFAELMFVVHRHGRTGRSTHIYILGTCLAAEDAQAQQRKLR